MQKDEKRKEGRGWYEVTKNVPGVHAKTGLRLKKGDVHLIAHAHAAKAYFKPCDAPIKGPANCKDKKPDAPPKAQPKKTAKENPGGKK
jgi:hypothetical protein